MKSDDAAAEIGTGVLARAAAVVYWLLVIEGMLVVSTCPALVAVVFLAGDEANAPLIGLCFVPLAPALSAAVFAWRVFLDDRDLTPAGHFVRGYTLNCLDVLRWWVPTVAFLTVIGFTLANLELGGVPDGYGLVLLVIAVGVLLWSSHALVLSSALALRTRDVARLAAYYLAARPAATLGVLSLLVAAIGLVVLVSDWLLVLLAAPYTLALLHNARSIVRDATERFTA